MSATKQLDAFAEAIAELNRLQEEVYPSKHAISCIVPVRPDPKWISDGKDDSKSTQATAVSAAAQTKCPYCEKNVCCSRCGVYDRAIGCYVCRPCHYQRIISNKHQQWVQS